MHLSSLLGIFTVRQKKTKELSKTVTLYASSHFPQIFLPSFLPKTIDYLPYITPTSQVTHQF